MQSNGALHLQRISIDAVVEDVADTGFGMRKETVLAWAVLGRLGLLCRKKGAARKRNVLRP